MAFSGEKIGNFSWEDPFLLTEQLNEEERLISGTARAFAREKLMPRIVDAFAEETTIEQETNLDDFLFDVED